MGKLIALSITDAFRSIELRAGSQELRNDSRFLYVTDKLLKGTINALGPTNQIDCNLISWELPMRLTIFSNGTTRLLWSLAALILASTSNSLTCSRSLAAVFNVQSYGATGNGITDDRAAIQATINAAIKAGPGNEVYLPAGNYMLSPDSQSSSEQFDIFQANGLTIQGVSGTVLLNPSVQRNFFYLWADSGLTISNIVLRRSVRKFSQMVVNSINTTDNTVLVTIMPGYDQLNAANVSGDGPLLLVYSNPSSGTWGDHQKDCGFFVPSSTSVCWPPTIMSRTQLSSTQWLLKLNATPQSNYVGAEAVMWVYTGGGSAFVATASTNVLIQRVAYYAAGADGGFYLAGNSGPFTFDTFTIDVAPGTKDLVAASGGSYAYNNHTALTIKNSRIVAVWDDAVNVGANSARVFDVVNSNTIDVDGSRAAFNVGDTFAIWDWTYLAEYQRQQAIATAVSCASGVCRVTFDRNLIIKNTGHASSIPEGQDGIDRVIDVTSAGSLTVTNSTFQSLHARDLVFRPSNTVIRGNTFKNTIGPAIYTGFDFDCDEGPASSNDAITSNNFYNISSTNILIGTEGDGSTYSTAENDASGITISNNVFVGLGEFPQGPVGDVHAAIMLRAGGSLTATNNKYSSFSPNFSIVPNGVDAVTSSSNNVFGNVLITAAQYNLLALASIK